MEGDSEFPPLFTLFVNGGGSGRGFQRLNDPRQYRLDVMQNIVVPKANHVILFLLLQPARAFSIVLRLCRITVAILIHFDD